MSPLQPPREVFPPRPEPGDGGDDTAAGQHSEREQRYARELEESERRFRTLAEALPILVWTSLPDGTVDYRNRRWTDDIGLAVDAPPEVTQGYLHPDDRQAVEALWRQVLAEERSYENEVRLRTADGSYRWYLFRALPQHDATGRVVKWIGTGTDIDHQRRHADDLRDADRRKDEFLAMLAHELRNPLSPIVSAVEILRRRGLDDPVLVRQRDIISRQVAQMRRLLDDLLDVSRITRGKIELRRQRVDLAEVIAAALETCQPLLARHRLVSGLAVEPVWLEADATRLAQVFVNLLSNAAKFTPAEGLIEITTELEDGAVTVTVRDEGEGMDAATLAQAFELFAQAEHGLDRQSAGLGIGLTLARTLTEMHGGTLTAASAGRGHGSQLRVRLPTAPAPASVADAAAGARSADPHGGGRTVLVVDDNVDSAEALALLLGEHGFAAHAVHTAHDGLAAAAELSPVAVVLDIGLPEMDGYELARRLRAHAAHPDLLLVALTGYGQEEDRLRALAAGFDHHLVKPVEVDRLLALLAPVAPG